jgi:hypothetical protein
VACCPIGLCPSARKERDRLADPLRVLPYRSNLHQAPVSGESGAVMHGRVESR